MSENLNRLKITEEELRMKIRKRLDENGINGLSYLGGPVVDGDDYTETLHAEPYLAVRLPGGLHEAGTRSMLRAAGRSSRLNLPERMWTIWRSPLKETMID